VVHRDAYQRYGALASNGREGPGHCLPFPPLGQASRGDGPTRFLNQLFRQSLSFSTSSLELSSHRLHGAWRIPNSRRVAVLARLGVFKDDLRPFTVVTVPFPKRETVRDPLWTGYFIMPDTERLTDLHGRMMVNIVSGESFHIYDKNSSRLPKPPDWLSPKTMEDEINHILSRCREPKASSPLPTVAHAQAEPSARLRPGISSRVSFIASVKRRQRAGRAVPIRPCWLTREHWTRQMRPAASTSGWSARSISTNFGHKQSNFLQEVSLASPELRSAQ
jgi:hypothetical protein